MGERAEELRLQGYSNFQIAADKKMQELRPGIRRNAIIGWFHRQGKSACGPNSVIRIWTEERIERLRILADAGMADWQIAKQLDVKTSSARWKAYDLDIPLANHKIIYRKKRVWNPEPVPNIKRRPYVEPANVDGPDPKHIQIMDLKDHHCRWPIGEHPNVTSCGHQHITGSSYCNDHYRAAYRI